MPCLAYIYLLSNNCNYYNSLKKTHEYYGNSNYTTYKNYTDSNELLNTNLVIPVTNPPPPVTNPPPPVTNPPPPVTNPPPPVTNPVVLDDCDCNISSCDIDNLNEHINQLYINNHKNQLYINEQKKQQYINEQKKQLYINEQKKQLYINEQKKQQYINKQNKQIEKEINESFYLIVFIVILGILIWIFALCLLISNMNYMNPYIFILAFLQLFGIPIPIGGPIITIFIVLATSSKYNKKNDKLFGDNGNKKLFGDNGNKNSKSLVNTPPSYDE